MNQSIKASLIASAAVALLAGCASSNKPMPTAPTGAKAETVRCQGINECKGRGECSGVGHPCGAHTACKGQGWLTVPSAEECAKRGGKVL